MVSKQAMQGALVGACRLHWAVSRPTAWLCRMQPQVPVKAQQYGTAVATPFNDMTAHRPAKPPPQLDADQRHKALCNALMYRSKQRGFLEMDLLVGLWAEQHLPRLAEAQLHEFAAVLDHENPDLFKWLTGQAQAPQDLLSNSAYQAMSASIAKQLADNSLGKARAPQGTDWVRGWDDSSMQKPAAEQPQS